MHNNLDSPHNWQNNTSRIVLRKGILGHTRGGEEQ